MNLKNVLLSLLLLFSVNYLMAQPIITKSVTQPICNNSDGTASVSVTGGLAPYIYEWRMAYGNNPVFSNSASVSDLSPGYYIIRVTDSNNDYAEDSVNIGNGIHAYAYTVTNALCPQNNGTVEAIASGGVAPYSYLWSNGQTTQTATNLAGGSVIQVEIKDANGCIAFDYNGSSVFETTVGVTSPINVTYSATPEECPLNNGNITLHATGGKLPYSYYWNTIPAQNTASITGLVNGLYNGTVMDADGCKTIVNVYVNKNSGALDATATKTNDNCSKQQGTAEINITGGVAPYTVKWPDGSSVLSRTDLGYGFYNVSITDQNNCEFILTIFIDDLSPVNAWVSTTETDCDNISGSAFVNVSGGTAPYTYDWNTGASGTSLSTLGVGYYSILVKDVNGCKATDWAYVNIKSSCYATISGKIFQDNNANCVQDAGEYSIMNQWPALNATAASYSLYDHFSQTNFAGQYSMRYVLPDQYTVNYQDNALTRTAVCPAAGKYNLNIPVSGVNYPDKDFAMVPASLYEDVAILPYYGCLISAPRPGFDYSYYFGYSNIGTLPSDGFIEVVYGDLETFVSASPAADFYDPGTKTLRFNYSTLMLGEVRGIFLTFNLPRTTLLGSTYSHAITADIGSTDPTPENNVFDRNFTVVGSFDPNDLTVTPQGNITEQDKTLTYSIRFQNTGTYPAELVVIKDTIDANLDITSIGNLVASHNYTYRVLENRIVEFAFENINLPDNERNEPGSHGFINFTIRKNKNLAVGTQIKNIAGIYFDYNDPIVTNTTINTMAETTLGNISQTATNTGNVYPNPAKDLTTFVFEKEISNVQLLSVSGSTVLNQPVSNRKEFNLQLNLTKGMYFYKAVSSDGIIYSGKLVIE